METKHTKGEWTAKGNAVFCDNKQICATYIVNFNHDKWGKQIKDLEQEGNAKLIAAAPELLEALDYLIKCNTIDRFKCETGDAIEKAINAINKATK